MEKKKNAPVSRKAALPRRVKIIAAILAVALVLGCGLFACWRFVHFDRNGDDRCDLCGEFMCVYVWEHDVTDCRCRICGCEIHLTDTEHDGWCITCGVDMMINGATGHRPQDGDADTLCDTCGGSVSIPPTQPVHEDSAGDGDSLCDLCGEPLCLLDPDLHRLDEYCTCLTCGSTFHEDSDGSGICDKCTVLLCVDLTDAHDFDGCVCRLCGIELHRAGIVHAFCGHCGERLSMTDRNGDNICDDCGQSHYALSTGPDDEAPHGDSDSDGLCDCCGEYLCRIGGMDDIDRNGDGVCDTCGSFICTDHHGRVSHRDDDANGLCDICGVPYCAMGYLPHRDDDGSGSCDICGAPL